MDAPTQQPENTIIRIGRKLTSDVKEKNEAMEHKRKELQQSVESEATGVTLFLLLLLITSISLLLGSYWIEHGQLISPL